MLLTDPQPGPAAPYLSKTQVRRAAAVLLEEYAARFTPVTAPPVPVEEIIEAHLGLTVEIADLSELFGAGDVLGAIWMAEKTVRIDANLDPSVHAGMLGRYRFTQAHEAGHWRLHRRLFPSGDVSTVPSVICRSSQAKLPIEWQADYFAANLLMPAHLVRAAWDAWHGNLCPVAFGDTVAVDRFVRPLATSFEVSAEPMRIRLEELGLVQLPEHRSQ
jgi:hypothetical protein